MKLLNPDHYRLPPALRARRILDRLDTLAAAQAWLPGADAPFNVRQMNRYYVSAGILECLPVIRTTARHYASFLRALRSLLRLHASGCKVAKHSATYLP